MNRITSVSAIPWNVPMRSPYRSAQRVTTVAQNVLVTVVLEDGSVGYGESAPARYVTGETQESVTQAAHSTGELLVGLTPEEALKVVAVRLTQDPGARGALEIALYDADCRAENLPLFAALNTLEHTPTTSLQTDISLPILPPEEAGLRAIDFATRGFRAFKIKVGSGDLAEDEARVRAVAQAAPNATLRIDGNQGFTATSAVAFVERISDLLPRLELFEQPTIAGDDISMFIVQSDIPIPVFADESVHHAEDAQHLISEGICRGIVLKLAKSGLVETAEIARVAHQSGGKCLFGCMMETRIGITAALHLAVALGSDIVPMLDLDGHMLVNDSELLSGGLTQAQDMLSISPTVAGLGILVL